MRFNPIEDGSNKITLVEETFRTAEGSEGFRYYIDADFEIGTKMAFSLEQANNIVMRLKGGDIWVRVLS